jgi:uncharacterized protein YjbJ (UPF0337 family)
MNQDQVKGRAKELKGDLKEAAGKAMDNERMESEGQADQVEGKVQKTYGDVKRDVGQAIDKDSTKP